MAEEYLRPYDAIRPFEPEELPAAFDRMMSEPQFRAIVAWLYPDAPTEAVAKKMKSCTSGLDFQKKFCYQFLESLLKKVATDIDFDVTRLDTSRRYTFISNHRDIVLDSALLSKLLIDNGFSTTCEIAIGDNLLRLPWVKDLVRVNKSFIVERSLPPRQLIAASKRMADYMHLVISRKNDNVWIAQREGRAKDSDDRTQESILKMMALGGEGTPVERLIQLHIAPLAISYEYDPCDYLKAAEMQQRRDIPQWKKRPMDDVVSMKTGILGYKGRIHYEAAPCIDTWLQNLPAETPKNELFHLAAAHIDSKIFAGYRLYPANYIALDTLEGTNSHAQMYTSGDTEQFEAYIEGQMKKIEIDHADTDFLRRHLLCQYANPARNKLGLNAEKP